ncbi:MAG TPA: hypothetical protein VK611_08870 [Acidimicrobiales bacterium]|nr:hypothetical protein [Acidimicrobiales bacterium]
MSTMQLYSPRPVEFDAEVAEQVAMAASQSFVGQTVALVDNGKLLGLGQMLEEELVAHGAAKVLRFRAPRYTDLATTEFLDDIAAKAHGAITGLGN